MTLIHQPFDKLFKQSLKERQVALDFFQAHLPAELHRKVDWSTLHAIDKSYLTPALQETHSDMVFSCQIDGKSGYIPILFLVEHFSTVPAHMAFRFLHYTFSIMEDHLKAGHPKLPVVLPMCVYHGKTSPFPAEHQDIYQDFEDPEFARQWVFQPFQLIDLTVLSADTLQQHGTAALVELLLKQAWMKDMLSTFRDTIQLGILSQVIDRTTKAYLLSVLNYGLDQKEQGQSADELIALITGALPEHREVIMTFKDQLEQRAMQQGLQAGILQGIEKGKLAAKLETAREMISNRFDLSIIKKITGLSDTDLASIESEDDE